MEPLWDIILPSVGLLVGTSLGIFGMQLTLGLTFVPGLLKANAVKKWLEMFRIQ